MKWRKQPQNPKTPKPQNPKTPKPLILELTIRITGFGVYQLILQLRTDGRPCPWVLLRDFILPVTEGAERITYEILSGGDHSSSGVPHSDLGAGFHLVYLVLQSKVLPLSEPSANDFSI